MCANFHNQPKTKRKEPSAKKQAAFVLPRTRAHAYYIKEDKERALLGRFDILMKANLSKGLIGDVRCGIMYEMLVLLQNRA